VAHVTYSARTRLAPEVVFAALTDFSDRRMELWPDLSGSYNLIEWGDTWARVREATDSLGIWVIERYDWSQPGQVIAVSEDSNVVQPGGEWRTALSPTANGGTRLDVTMNRKARGWRGYLLHAVIQATGGRLLALRLGTTLKRLERAAI
jgi:hypothetical protein